MMHLISGHQNPHNVELSSETDLVLKKYNTEPVKNLPKKRKRVGKTPADKINWTPEEVSVFFFTIKHIISGLNRNFLKDILHRK
jgi:hypothetical protein|tara:strand:+ start:286 stop:537 length:252 start_codon:yes stop_codon:yes gene_type:complete